MSRPSVVSPPVFTGAQAKRVDPIMIHNPTARGLSNGLIIEPP